MPDKKIYMCHTKILGLLFAVETKEQAVRFEKADTKNHFVIEVKFFDKNDQRAGW